MAGEAQKVPGLGEVLVFGKLIGFGLIGIGLSTGVALADDWVAVKLRGEVQQQVGGQWQPIAKGAVVSDSRRVQTLASGHVEFVRGQEHVELGPNSQVQIFDKGGIKPFTTVQEAFGTVSIEAKVENVQHFAVETPYLAAVVKGTKFTVVSGEGTASVAVMRGHVAVEDKHDKSHVTVTVGQSAVVDDAHGLTVSGKGKLPVVLDAKDQPIAAVTVSAAPSVTAADSGSSGDSSVPSEPLPTKPTPVATAPVTPTVPTTSPTSPTPTPTPSEPAPKPSKGSENSGKSSTSSSGSSNSKGSTGDTGSKDGKGSKDDKGSKSNSGSKDEKGSKDNSGSKGNSGSKDGKDSKDDKGSKGDKGPKGDHSSDGDKGNTAGGADEGSSNADAGSGNAGGTSTGNGSHGHHGHGLGTIVGSVLGELHDHVKPSGHSAPSTH